jgi:hypothetical protein
MKTGVPSGLATAIYRPMCHGRLSPAFREANIGRMSLEMRARAIRQRKARSAAREAAAENLTRLRDARPLKPPGVS